MNQTLKKSVDPLNSHTKLHIKTPYPLQWKIAVIFLIPKRSKPPDITSFYLLICLLPFFTKLTEKLILKRLSKIINDKKIIPNTQFGFRNKHSILYQVHRLTDSIAHVLEKKQYCSVILLDVA